ncbi:MAG: alpha/beta hydrolase [Candidatus Binatia bacterium]
MTNEEALIFHNSRGDTLSGVLHHPAAKKPNGAVILCHGMESDKNSDKLIFLGRKLAEKGVLALRFDFAYAGESSGQFEDITYSGEVEDLKAAYAVVQDRRPGKTAVLGSSMGGTVALLFAAAEPRIAALVTVAAPVHPENFPRRLLSAAQLQDWRERGFTFFNGQRLNVSLLEDLERLNVPESARNVHCPVLILHGDADDVVPVEEAHELHDSLSGAKRLSILNGADHRLANPVLMQRAIEEALTWLTEHVR